MKKKNFNFKFINFKSLNLVFIGLKVFIVVRIEILLHDEPPTWSWLPDRSSRRCRRVQHGLWVRKSLKRQSKRKDWFVFFYDIHDYVASVYPWHGLVVSAFGCCSEICKFDSHPTQWTSMLWYFFICKASIEQ